MKGNIIMNFEPTLITSTEKEISHLNKLTKQHHYTQYSEMSDQDRNFLNSLILREKPKKIVEIGVAKGGSSGIILNAIKNLNGAHLFSVDLNKECYSLKGKLTGFLMDDFPELKKKWTLLTGGTIYDYIDQIGDNVDLVLIDTVHANPGEILDTLGIFPYLKKEAVIVFHDTNLQICQERGTEFTNNTLMSAIYGEKIIPSPDSFEGLRGYFNNIAAIRLNGESLQNIYNVLNLLALHWTYFPTLDQLNKIKHFIKKHYGEFYVRYFENIISVQKKLYIEKINEHKRKKKYEILSIYSELKEDKKSHVYKYRILNIFGLKIKYKAKRFKTFFKDILK